MTTWRNIASPIVTGGFARTFGEAIDVFTVLFFADDATIILNDQAIERKSYLRDIWGKKFGGDRGFVYLR